VSGEFQVQVFVAADQQVGWRLLSGNNREIGRGAQRHPDADACRLAVAELREGVADLSSRVRRTPPNRWTWELLRDEQPLVLAGHSFDRMIRCQQSLQVFLAQFGSARLTPSVADFAARRWTVPLVPIALNRVAP
jgi:hypothetical protein